MPSLWRWLCESHLTLVLQIIKSTRHRGAPFLIMRKKTTLSELNLFSAEAASASQRQMPLAMLLSPRTLEDMAGRGPHFCPPEMLRPPLVGMGVHTTHTPPPTPTPPPPLLLKKNNQITAT